MAFGQSHAAWFSAKQDQDPYPYLVTTRMGIRPETVDPARYGHHRSVGSFNKGFQVRKWAFKEEAGRDLFAVVFADKVING